MWWHLEVIGKMTSVEVVIYSLPLCSSYPPSQHLFNFSLSTREGCNSCSLVGENGPWLLPLLSNCTSHISAPHPHPVHQLPIPALKGTRLFKVSKELCIYWTFFKVQSPEIYLQHVSHQQAYFFTSSKPEPSKFASILFSKALGGLWFVEYITTHSTKHNNFLKIFQLHYIQLHSSHF